MRKITSLTSLKALLKKDRIIIRVLPYMENLVKKYCPECVEVPREFNSVDELQNWRDYIKSKSTYKIVGRSYVIDLLLNNVNIGEGDLKIRGNIITISPYKAISYVSKKLKNKEDTPKILDYSILILKGYSTYIPALLTEGIKLSNIKKIDESLKIFNKFRRILYINENQFHSPQELLKNVYKGTNLREDWEKLSPIWKEIIYYLIDSSLGLLPGQAKRELSIFDYSTEEEDISPIPYPEYVDIVNLAVAELMRGNSVVLLGNLKTGKSTIAELIRKRSLEHKLQIDLVDYHDINGNYTSIEKLKSDKKRTLYVLTEDLFQSLEINNVFKIFTNERFIYSLSKDKGLTLRLDERIAAIPMHYIIMFQTDNIETTVNKALENFYYDYWEYVYNVIFDADPNKILWYSPILAIYDKYNTSIPIQISLFVLKSTGRKNVNDNDLILKWFSKCNIPFRIPKSPDYYTDVLDQINVDDLLRKISEEIVNSIRTSEAVDNILEAYSYLTINEGNEPNIVSELNTYFDNNLSFVKIILPYIVEKIKDKIDVERYCKELGYLKQPYETLARIKGILMKRADENCYSLAIDTLLSASKNGKVEWIRFVLDDILTNINYLKKSSYKIIAMLFNYLKYSRDDIDKIKKIFYNVENESKYSIFLKSLLDYNDGSLDDLSFDNPLWATLGYGFLGIYSLSNHDLLKLAMIYDKFRKSYSIVKSNKISTDDPHLKDFFPINNGIHDYIDELKDRLDAGIGYTLLLTHPKEESARATIELAEKLMLNWYTRIKNKLKSGKIKDEEAMDLLKIYQIKLMKSLISGGKYEYKSVLQDITELENLSNIVYEPDVKGSLSIASYIAKRVLGMEEKPRLFSGTTLDLLIYISSEILLGAEDKSKFFDFIANQIKNKEEGIDKALVGIIISVIRNDKKELDKALEYARENYYSVMLEILSRYVNDRKMFVVTLIPYIGMWHFLGG
ncbi:hypothetical protein [Sulfurisphaera ohwakuensis]|uniref:hypothetical protein n=1 Tax=Sulfurisphaera ohwakuensis TaxID=69656 RepID=UPI0036F230CE